MSILILGASSFIGRHLASELRGRGLSVAGTYHSSNRGVEAPSYSLDILHRQSVCELLEQVRPQVVYHLAGESWPSRCWHNPQRCYEVNLIGTANVAEACAALSEPPLLAFPSSSHVYGNEPPEGRGLLESDACAPASPYGIAKWATERHLEAMAHRSGLRTVIFRLFNQFGPGQRGPFFVPEMAEAIIRLEQQDAAGPARLYTGNLNLRRDFLDVRDAVKALAQVTHAAQAPIMTGKIYNLGSGTSMRLLDLLGLLLAASKVSVTIQTDPSKLRTQDPRAFWSNITRLQTDTGWRPQRSLQASLKEVLEELRRGDPP